MNTMFLSLPGRSCFLLSAVGAVGKVEIPRSGRDFQAEGKSLLVDFSAERLFHSPVCAHILRGEP